MHNISLEYWTAEGLSHLASVVGMPLFVDYAIENCKRLNFARICVELDAAKPLVKEFEAATLQSKSDASTSLSSRSRIQVTFQWKPPMCAHCSLVTLQMPII